MRRRDEDAAVCWRDVARTALAAKGAFRRPWLAEAFDAVDRERFVPSRFWGLPARDDGRCPLLDREEDEERWRRAVWDTRRSAIVQMDDGATAPDGPARGDFTSSVSALDIAYEKLCHLDLEPHHRVLEIGTASGYNTALLCERVGSARVATVEVDPVLAAWGADNLKRAGYASVRAVCGDGLAGGPPDRAALDPYDRVLSTASVRRIPTAWLAQTADGGVILTPFGTAYANAGLLKLRVRDGRAQGTFVGSAHYMWVRGQRPRRVIDVPDGSRPRASPLDPAEVLQGSWQQDFAIGLHVRDIDYTHRGDGADRQVQLWDESGTSAAVVSYDAWWRRGAVRVWGPRDLWREAVTAYTWWRTHGRPDLPRFGLSVETDGTHSVWLDEPGRRVG
ncbi:protein-L-isoaspartate(D-aspartate) O-methyltransferase [Streptomyces sp. NPDC052496]|uniref:protein-L-isoaspartate(D-aspartate) O-methyltransferase n=1 Tax=Streptomyces sp. NPDC052496 TaxID=3154951 RepID=UPI0034434A1A